MTKNNSNVWGGLMNPVGDRPGTPVGTRSVVHTPNKVPSAPLPREPKQGKTHVHMPASEVAAAHQRSPDDPWTKLLSPRQHQVLDMLVQGMSPTQIARTLGLGKSSISKYTTEIKERLGVQTLPQAVVAWHRHYRVLHPDRDAANKDNALIANLARATEAARADRKEAA